MTISFGSIFLFSRGDAFLLGSGPSRNGVRAFIIGGRRSVSVEVLIELVTKIQGNSEPLPSHYQVNLPSGEVNLKSSMCWEEGFGTEVSFSLV